MTKRFSTPETVEGALSRSSYPIHIKNAPIADKTMRAGENKSRVMKRGLDLAFLFAPPKYQGLCLLIGLCNRAFSIRRRLTFCKNGWSGFMCYHQRFRDRYVYPLRGVPYFVPPTKASSIRTYSIVSVPYHLCLAVVFGHHPTGGSYPTSMCCIKNQLWGKPFPINPKLSYQSCHRSAMKALIGQLNTTRLASRLGLALKECRSNQ